MSIHVHKAGINKTTGRTGASIVTTNLIGNFDPSNIGSDANAWDNLVGSGNNLRRYNGITHNNSAPHNFEFDGTNDYLGEASSGYGGTAFTFESVRRGRVKSARGRRGASGPCGFSSQAPSRRAVWARGTFVWAAFEK